MAKYHISELVPYTKNFIKGIGWALFETAQAVNERMKEPGEAVTYPIQWDTELQKVAYFASNGFGAGIPYQRTNQYILGGTVTKTSYGAQFFNPHPAGAIGGTVQGWQSAIHWGRWTYLREAIQLELENLPRRIRERVKYNEGTLE